MLAPLAREGLRHFIMALSDFAIFLVGGVNRVLPILGNYVVEPRITFGLLQLLGFGLGLSVTNEHFQLSLLFSLFLNFFGGSSSLFFVKVFLFFLLQLFASLSVGFLGLPFFKVGHVFLTFLLCLFSSQCLSNIFIESNSELYIQSIFSRFTSVFLSSSEVNIFSE